MASKIEDYWLIGNTNTSVLVSRGGSIDGLCASRFDFRRLLHGARALRLARPLVFVSHGDGP